MKIFKFYENIEDELTVGDYVLVKINISKYTQKLTDIENFINSTIGKIYSIDNRHKNTDIYVLYDDVPESIKSYFNIKNDLCTRNFDIRRIVEHSKTIEELKMKLETKKFNI